MCGYLREKFFVLVNCLIFLSAYLQILWFMFPSISTRVNRCWFLIGYLLLRQPHSPDNRGLARECKDVKVDRVYIGSCTGGKTEDFIAAAELLAVSVSFQTYLQFYLALYRSTPQSRFAQLSVGSTDIRMSITGPKSEGANVSCTCYAKGMDGLVLPASSWN